MMMEGAASSLDPPRSSCGGEVEPIPMSCMVCSTGLI
jgi:hypothetical protein